jgi:NADPH-dependent 2,4-dienoyl-CoA reductase/sulfur reductase-like enzyme
VLLSVHCGTIDICFFICLALCAFVVLIDRSSDCALLGIELVLGTWIKSADVKRRMLRTAAGETITYKILIIATGARV